MKRKEIKIGNPENVPINKELHRVELEDDFALLNNRKENNCKASIIVTKGLSRSPAYSWYPYWSIGLMGQDGTKVIWTPTKDLMMNIVSEFFLHEERTDYTRDRRDELKVHEKKIKEILNGVQQKIKDFEIPEAYKIQKKIK